MKRKPPVVRLPFAPIAARLRRDPNQPSRQPGPDNWYGLSLLARDGNLSRQTVHSWKRLGVPLQSADRAARAIGVEHPFDLWGADYYAACDAYQNLVTPRTRSEWGCAA